MYRGIETELLDRATIIMEDYIPLVWNSSNYRLNILDVILDNKGWTKEMIRFVQIHEEDTELYKGLDYRTMITQTLMHDIGGLMRNDEHFLPRI
tara:strand:- start:1505 stop:1786 length:282 start_codon:yes stop_codon:yes gene_type:complete